MCSVVGAEAHSLKEPFTCANAVFCLDDEILKAAKVYGGNSC